MPWRLSEPSFPDFQSLKIESDWNSNNIERALEVVESTCRELTMGSLSVEAMVRFQELLECEYGSKTHDNEYIIDNALFGLSEIRNGYRIGKRSI